MPTCAAPRLPPPGRTKATSGRPGGLDATARDRLPLSSRSLGNIATPSFSGVRSADPRERSDSRKANIGIRLGPQAPRHQSPGPGRAALGRRIGPE